MIFQCSFDIPALSISEKSDLPALFGVAMLSPQGRLSLTWMPAKVNNGECRVKSARLISCAGSWVVMLTRSSHFLIGLLHEFSVSRSAAGVASGSGIRDHGVVSDVW